MPYVWLRVTSVGTPSLFDVVMRDELRELTNAMTTNLTAFFRERHHFDMLREHRGNLWERLASGLLRVNLSNDLTDYEERRVLDRRKLEAMVSYCQTARCYTRFILEYFGETDVEPDWRCRNCGSCDALDQWEARHGEAVESRRAG